MSDQALYRRHLAALDTFLADALQRAGKKGVALDGVVLHAGRMTMHHADDQPLSFRPTPHYLRYVPLHGPEHLVLAVPGRKPVVVRVAPADFWEEVLPLSPSYWQNSVELHQVETFDQAVKALGPLPKVAYIGNSAEAAATLGIATEHVEPNPLMQPLDWHRGTKTEHEVALMDAACVRGAEGHRVARKAFESGASEREVHWAYLQACDHMEEELPFTSIVAFDEKAATLHFHNKRGRESAPGTTFIMDSGAMVDGYASDITRTWTSRNAEPLFVKLVELVDQFQRELVAMVTPGRPYQEIHVAAHRYTAQVLCELRVFTCSADQAFESGLTRTFLPHGVGHHLGIQVHDVGGRQAGPDGGTVAPPDAFPALRTTRQLAPGHVVTIEPGIYFIPMLLRPLQQGPLAAHVDWRLVERLLPCGGVRIEDDVLCTEAAARDLTRPYIQGPRGV